MASETTAPAISVDRLTFAYNHGLPPIFQELSLTVKAGSRTLLVGANGAGKSTLLRILAGLHMVQDDAARVYGHPAFRDTLYSNQNIAFLGEAWSRAVPWVSTSVPYAADIAVSDMVRSLYGDPRGSAEEIEEEAARRDRLLELLDIDPEWRLHNVSDGQRKRVIILLKLLQSYKVLLLDEVTTHLDVIARQDFLQFLREESEQRNVTILYATHIFDGLEDWATDMVHLSQGRIVKAGRLEDFAELQERLHARVPAPLLTTVEAWLRRERQEQASQQSFRHFFRDRARQPATRPNK